MTAAEIAEILDGKRIASGWIARCPAHDDRNPSLSITDGSEKVLLHCHAGCPQSAVIASLRSIGAWRPDHQEQSWIVATYDYTDERGDLLYQVLRYHPKAFKQRRPDGLGGWTWKKGERQVLYRLCEVVEAPIVFVVEGERDVETLREHGFVATCNPMGAGKWRDEYNELFAGKTVILIPDCDEPGRAHARRIYAAITPFAAQVLCLDLETAKDITEWFEQGHSEVELVGLLEQFWSKVEVRHG
jgi:5S rRNA maturation endonuclease (ribonuclease M5)